MAKNDFSEEELETETIRQVTALGGYQSVNAASETFGHDGLLGRKTTEEVVLPLILKQALIQLNPDLPNEAIDNALYAMTEGKSALGLVKANQAIYRLMKDGVLVTYKDDNGIEKQSTVKIIDWNRPEANNFLIVRQFKISGEVYNCRSDAIIFVNGLPLVLIELKASHTHLINGFTGNISHYKQGIPQLFWYNALIVISKGTETKIGSLTSDWEHYADWKKINAAGEHGIISLDTVIKGVFEPSKLLDIVENFVLYMESSGGTNKIIAKNHQYLGVNSTIESIKNREKLNGKLGVFWHTQGSGKSFSMVFLTQKVLRKLPGNWTFLIVTDREDLDNQIYNNFVKSGAVTEKEVRATSKNHLKKLLSEDHRTVFTMIQKFGSETKDQSYKELSDRKDIIVITDEAHRSQYKGLAMNMRSALPKASFLAFTGTPLIKGDEKTKEVFGDYVSIYNFKQSVDDNATVKLFYENRIPELQIVNRALDDDIKAIIEEADLTDEQEENFAKKYVNTYQLITKEERLEKIAEDVVEHFVNRGFTGKAMFIAIDKATAVKMYDKVRKYWSLYIVKIEKQLLTCDPSHWQTLIDKRDYMNKTDMAVIVSKAQSEIEELKRKGVDITPHRKRMNENDLAEEFKSADTRLRLVFVCAMWITGFDAPSVSTLYLDKILQGHTLMQTMARANRVWKDKPNGLVVDYIGIFHQLQEALAIYGNAEADGVNDDNPIQDKNELVEMLANVSLEMRVYLKKRGVSIEEIFNQSEHFKKIHLIDIAVESILENEKSKQDFFKLFAELDNLFNKILPDVRAEKHLKEIFIIKMIAKNLREKTSLYSTVEKERERRKIEALAEQVSRLINESITIENYEIKTPQPFNISQIDFDELKERFRRLDKKKTALEQLKLDIQYKIQELLQFNSFNVSYLEKFEALIKEYNSGDVDTEKLFLELVKFSRDLQQEESRYIRENLTQEELVIFDILTKPEPKLSRNEIKAVKEVAKELLGKLKNELLIIEDWRKKQSTRAKVVNLIEEICDKLPKIYDAGIFQAKCKNLYEHIYDRYPNGYHLNF